MDTTQAVKNSKTKQDGLDIISQSTENGRKLKILEQWQNYKEPKRKNCKNLYWRPNKVLQISQMTGQKVLTDFENYKKTANILVDEI